MMPKPITAADAAALIPDQATLAIGGAGAGHNVPDRLLEAVGERFRNTGQPRSLTTYHACGIGDNDRRGLNHIAHEGLVRRNIGGFWGNAPRMITLAREEKIEGYNFPQGVLSHLLRSAAGGEEGLLTKIGLHTFVDPRYEGGRVNKLTTEELVEAVAIGGKEHLFYRAPRIDVAFIRGSSVDARGNLTMEEEVGTFSMLSLAQAARANGGVVIAQVKQVREDQHAKPVQVKVPGVLIDYVVEVPEQTMTFITDYEPAMVDRQAPYEGDDLSLVGIKRIVARRAAQELEKGSFVNLGYGIPDGVPIVAREQGRLDELTFLIEQGQIDGVISTGLNFGAMYNPSAIVDDGYQFDFFHGGGLDICYLGFAQVDRAGNVNSSRFGKTMTGCGGFIDISQPTPRVVFCGSLAAKAEVAASDGKLTVQHPGKIKKFVDEVEQVTFNGHYARQQGQRVQYITERAVFRLTAEGLELTEIAPGVDLEQDVLAMMDFTPAVSSDLKTMNEHHFTKA
ncbi:acyl CoA:acetate/3-ketoacid CoA transferase [Tunicatimonas pelagia]|uniref:acyl CoA:acetate/3-ketoacid CoA transferase n=1 Tax=Tunicatimonas pelagia TaxID=931531 RepID=UPI00266522AC|nr:CoA-transferase [Tunicatimonas pelagia]WKN44863.1 CoA-transferase [Tunicatimonas pelagia]